MDKVKLLLTSSIGRKFVMGGTGLALIGFLVSHMLGNLLLLKDAGQYNAYSEALISNPLIYIAEAGLLLLFVMHFATGIALTRKNRAAKPVAYQRNDRAGGPSRKSLASTTMIVSGLVLLAFVPLHINTFKFGAWYETGGADSMRDLARLVVEIFQSPAYVLFYVVSLLFMGFHAWHGFGSAFESLGVAHKNGLRRAGQALAVVLTCGFMIVPIIIYLSEGNL